MTERTKHRLLALIAIACFLLAAHLEYQDTFGEIDGTTEQR
jgi:hypothetical protein